MSLILIVTNYSYKNRTEKTIAVYYLIMSKCNVMLHYTVSDALIDTNAIWKGALCSTVATI